MASVQEELVNSIQEINVNLKENNGTFIFK